MKMMRSTKPVEKKAIIQRAVGVLTFNNPIDIFKLGRLYDVLDGIDRDRMAMLLASEYAPEPERWQDII